jgi:hypothetical protein
MINVKSTQAATIICNTGKGVFHLTWRALLLVVCALLVLGEPVVGFVLAPLAFLAFGITLLFGFIAHEAHFPTGAMLGFSLGAVILYWTYLGVMFGVQRMLRG